MNDSNLPVIYLSILVILLSGAGVVLLRQVFKTRKIENTFSRLQSKLSKGKGTAQEYYEFGTILLDKKLYSQAIAQFQKALKSKTLTDPDNKALVLNAIGFVYAAQEQYDLAIRHYKEALELQPNYVIALNNLGFAYEKKQLIAQSLEVYEQSLKINPNNTTAKRRANSLRKRLTPSPSSSET